MKSRSLLSERHTCCPVCGCRKLREKHRVKGYSIAECLGCTVQFVTNILSSDYLAAYYQDLEGHYAYEPDNRACVEYYYRRIKKRVEESVPGKGAILDVGCSAGYFLDLMDGWEKHGIEISAEYGNKARQKLGSGIFIGDLADFPEKGGYFDVITMQDVLDHFRDPYQALIKCARMLKPGGLLVIKVHDISCLYARLSGPRFYALIPPAHLFYFNSTSLRALLSRTGLQYDRAEHIGQILQLRTVFYRLARGEESGLFYKIYQLLNNSQLGSIRVYKNLHDIITVYARKGNES